MAIGRTFQESLQKALRGLETGLDGLTEQIATASEAAPGGRAELGSARGQSAAGAALDEEAASRLEYELRAPGPNRLLYTADAFRAGWPFARIAELTRIDPWFLAQIEDLVAEEARVRERG